MTTDVMSLGCSFTIINLMCFSRAATRRGSSVSGCFLPRSLLVWIQQSCYHRMNQFHELIWSKMPQHLHWAFSENSLALRSTLCSVTQIHLWDYWNSKSSPARQSAVKCYNQRAKRSTCLPVPSESSLSTVKFTLRLNSAGAKLGLVLATLYVDLHIPYKQYQ